MSRFGGSGFPLATASYDAEIDEALQARLERGADLDPYQCTYCSGWHLGNRRE